MQTTNIRKAAAIGTSCLAIGAVAGIAGSAAAPSSDGADAAKAGAAKQHAKLGKHRRAGRGAMAGLPARRALHIEAVVPERKGEGFTTVSADRGKLVSRSDSNLEIRQGTPKAQYRTVTLDAGGDPTVRRNGEAAKLSDLAAGDRVRVVHNRKGVRVIARDAAHAKAAKEKRKERRERRTDRMQGLGDRAG